MTSSRDRAATGDASSGVRAARTGTSSTLLVSERVGVTVNSETSRALFLPPPPLRTRLPLWWRLRRERGARLSSDEKPSSEVRPPSLEEKPLSESVLKPLLDWRFWTFLVLSVRRFSRERGARARLSSEEKPPSSEEKPPSSEKSESKLDCRFWFLLPPVRTLFPLWCLFSTSTSSTSRALFLLPPVLVRLPLWCLFSTLVSASWAVGKDAAG